MASETKFRVPGDPGANFGAVGPMFGAMEAKFGAFGVKDRAPCAKV